jgi:hypothetical protein
VVEEAGVECPRDDWSNHTCSTNHGHTLLSNELIITIPIYLCYDKYVRVFHTYQSANASTMNAICLCRTVRRRDIVDEKKVTLMKPHQSPLRCRAGPVVNGRCISRLSLILYLCSLPELKPAYLSVPENQQTPYRFWSANTAPKCKCICSPFAVFFQVWTLFSPPICEFFSDASHPYWTTDLFASSSAQQMVSLHLFVMLVAGCGSSCSASYIIAR